MVKKSLRKITPFLQLLFCLLLIAGIYLYKDYKQLSTNSDHSAGADLQADSFSRVNADHLSANVSLAESFSVSALYDTGNGLASIQLWQDADAGADSCYLFLPSYAGREMTLSFGSQAEGRIDGVLYQNGDSLILTDGTHTLSDAEDTETHSFTVLHSSNIATLHTHTESGSLKYLTESKENIETGEAWVVDPEGRTVYMGDMAGLSGHGNSSWFITQKRSFELKLPEQTDLFNMGAARDWILVSNCFDPSLLRNYITYDLAREIGLPYSPQAVYVDWYADGEYQGNYLLCEKIEIGKNRVAIADLEGDTAAINGGLEELTDPETVGDENARGSYKGFAALQNPADITGGYLFTLELNTEVEPRYGAELSGFVTYRNQAVVLKRPVHASLEQTAYIRNLYQAMEDAVCDESGFNPETGYYYTHYLDVDSFAKKYIIEEVTKNMDAQYSSQYFYKDADTVSSRIYAGPVWDYDRAWGCSGTRIGVDLMDPGTFYANQYTYEGTLWHHLYRQETFRDYVMRTFSANVLPELTETVTVKIDSLSGTLAASALMNDYRWHVTESASPDEKKASYQEACEQVRSFGEQRIVFLSEQWCR